MKIILIGNYIPDGQESMARFANMLAFGFRERGHIVEVWKPKVFFGKVASTTSGVGKWLGYLDKWVVYPLVLSWRTQIRQQYDKEVRFHICDHSNSPYLKHLPRQQTIITCHDVLAIRGALGDADTYCPASVFGKVLQKWIFSNLVKASRIAAVSQQTLHQLKNINVNENENHKDWRLIYNGFNADFKPMDRQRATSLIAEIGVKPERPFILHVGSCERRKNRKLLLDMVKSLGENWDGDICYAGEAADYDLLKHVRFLGLQERVFFAIKPDHATLVALYSCCEAFIFPSFSEGFGWPVIEAQACGALVITSDIEPMPEVSGGAALYASPKKPQEFADAFLSLKDRRKKTDLIRRGFANAAHFNLSQMIDSYLDLYGLSTFKKNMYDA